MPAPTSVASLRPKMIDLRLTSRDQERAIEAVYTFPLPEDSAVDDRGYGEPNWRELGTGRHDCVCVAELA